MKDGSNYKNALKRARTQQCKELAIKMRFGSKYQHLACADGCRCIELEGLAAALSRRGFFAAAALPFAASATFGIDSALAQDAKGGAGRVSAALASKAEGLVKADTDRLVALFKDIHQHPELGFMEVRTAAIVAKELSALGFEVQTGIGKTCVVGILRNGSGPTGMYRADMDANAVEEATGFALCQQGAGQA